MREILFRGKQVDNGEWVYGYIVKMLWEYIIIPIEDENTVYPVVPETVGQYTGLTDKNGKKIFEGDILEGEISCIRGFVEYNLAQAGYYVRSFDTGMPCLLIENEWCRIGTIYEKCKGRAK